MSSSSSLPVAVPSPRREWGVDLARGVAVVSMFVAHTAPGSGPGDVLVLSEFLTFPLFALLVGAGAELGARRFGVLPHLAASAVRAAALLALGWVLAQAGAHIVIVLAPLGVLTLLCWGVSRLPTGAVVAVGLAAGLLAPWTIEASRQAWTELAITRGSDALWWFGLLVSTSYPQAVLLLCGCVGIVLVRWLLPRDGVRPEWPALAVAFGASWVLVVGLAGARLAGVLDFAAYETSWTEELFVAALAAGTFAACLLLVRWGSAVRPLARLLTPLAWVGAMTLTVYTLQIGWLAWWVHEAEAGTSDDTWVNVVGLSVGALVVASAWRFLALPAPWTRGPLEGIVGVGVGLALKATAGSVPGAGRAEPSEVPEPVEIPVSSPRTEVRPSRDRG